MRFAELRKANFLRPMRIHSIGVSSHKIFIFYMYKAHHFNFVIQGKLWNILSELSSNKFNVFPGENLVFLVSDPSGKKNTKY